MNGVAVVKRTIFFGLQASGVLPLILGGGVVLVFALGALELNNDSVVLGHLTTSPKRDK
jgi:hypothetical protein